MVNKHRTPCESNIYHLTVRGVAKQIIFEDDVDYRHFGKRLREYRLDDSVDLFAWCFMSNHVHLLVHADLHVIAHFMRRLLVSYVVYFNTRHDRIGHLFQNRFDSTPVETDEQLMTVVRYIHRNPLSIPGETIADYPWSSFREYLGKPFISNTDYVLNLFDNQDEFIAFHEEWEEPANVQESTRRPRIALTDEEAMLFAKDFLDVESITSISSLDKPARNRLLVMLKDSGMSIEQIARITGIGRNIVQRANHRE